MDDINHICGERGIGYRCKDAVLISTIAITNQETLYNLNLTDSFRIETEITPADASSKKFLWKSSDEDVAVVDENGIVSLKSAGKVTITVSTTDGSKLSAKYTFKVDDSIPAESITLNEEQLCLDLHTNQLGILDAEVDPMEAEVQLKWESDNKTIAMVRDGLVIPVSHGETKIRCSSVEYPQVFGECTVSVHDFSVVKAEEGYKSCRKCPATQDICQPGEHQLTKTEAKAATCISAGNKEYYQCSICNKYFEDGEATKEITEKASVVENTVSHNTTEVAAKEPTLLEDGNIAYYICNGCEKWFEDKDASKEIVDRESVILPKKECKVGVATCVDKAVCEECHLPYGEVDPFHHVGVQEIRNASKATCTKDGYTGDTYCTSCEQKISSGETVEETGHIASEAVKENMVSATCTEKGQYENVVYCSVIDCNAELSREVIETDFAEHTDENGDNICDECEEAIVRDGLWIRKIEDCVYTGKAVEPVIEVYDGKFKLELNKDYSVKLTNNKKAGTGVVTITGKGNYGSVEKAEFSIMPRSIETDEFTADDIVLTVNGKEQKPKPVFLWNGKKVSATDYQYAYYRADENGDAVGEALSSVKEAGNYVIVITGISNLTGERKVPLLLTKELKPVSKLNVVKVAKQSYTGKEICPTLTVKDGKTLLTEGQHYTVEYKNNEKVGTAVAIIRGKDNYAGTKSVNFVIVGTPMKQVTVEGLPKSVTFTGNDITFDDLKLYVKAKAKTTKTDLTEDQDYAVTYFNHQKTGTATVVFTGMNGYSGELKKTFKIVPFTITEEDSERVKVEIVNDEVSYAKGGAKPEVRVSFKNADGTQRVLNEKTDYTLSYKNHTAVNDGTNLAKQPTVKVTLKGNCKGTITKAYKIVAKDIGQVKVEATDKVYQMKKGNYKTTFILIDSDGKKLAVNKDYSKDVSYTYKEETTVLNSGTWITRGADRNVEADDIVPAGTSIVLRITAKENGNYTGVVSTEYRIVNSSITSVKATINDRYYTGKAIEPAAEDVTVMMKNTRLAAGIDYEIVPDSYVNNVKKGTASVIIRGIGNYGGTQKVNFTIKAKDFKWWWKD